MHPAVKNILFWPYQLWVWLVLAPFVAIWSLTCGFLAVLVAATVSQSFASRFIARPWARVCAWLTPIFVTVEGAENADPNQSYIIVCNHESQYDILLIYGWLNLDVRWVMKKELRKIPGIGIGCEKVGHIIVDRKDPEQARAAINDALQVLGNDIGILFFPEGTRSRDGRLLPFKKGAFRVAIEQQVPLLPMTVIGTRDVLSAKSMRLFPGRVKLVIHPPIDTSGMDLQSIRELMDQARAVIESARLGSPDGSDQPA